MAPRRQLHVVLTLVCLVFLSATSMPAQQSELAPNPENAEQLKAIQDQVKQVFQKVAPAVVGVQVGNARGSGVIVSEDGVVMTAGHVVGKPGQAVTFFLHDGKTAKGKTLGMYKSVDAGLMKIEGEKDKKWPFVELGQSGELKIGQWCLAMGHPLGYNPKRPAPLRVGRVLQSRPTVIQTDCPLVGGDSGGPLFDMQGKVVGINSRIGGSIVMNFHAPTDKFRDNWDRMLKGEEWEDPMPGRDSGPVKTAFRPIVAEAAKCVVRIQRDGKDGSLGTIIGPDGWIVTKASELKGKIVCKLSDERELEARLVGLNPAFDLAMLKVDARQLPVIPWGKEKPTVGDWVAAAGTGEDPLAVGVVSVPPRQIPHTPGMLGVQLEEGEGGAKIKKVLPNSPALKAGLKDNDLITHADGKETPNRETLVGLIRQRRIGHKVKLKIRRGEEELEIEITLGKVQNDGTKKRDMQNAMGVGISGRRDDFPIVLQHDIALRPLDCGGPLVDLSGKVVGVNIARGGRTETYGVPSEVALTLMYDLISGRAKNDTIHEADKKAEEQLAAAKKAAADALAAEKAAREKAEAAAKTAEQLAAADKAAREKADSEKQASEKFAAEQLAARQKAEAAAKAAQETTAAAQTARQQAEAAAKAAQDAATKAAAARQQLESALQQVQQQLTAEQAARQASEQQLQAAQGRLDELQAELAKLQAEKQSPAEEPPAEEQPGPAEEQPEAEPQPAS